MVDISKLREGLKCCIKLQKGEPVSCEVCPYNGGRMTCETMLTILEDAAEAVEIAKAHMPRTLTLKELRQLPRTEMEAVPVLMETRHLNGRVCQNYFTWQGSDFTIKCYLYEESRIKGALYTKDTYGKNWRVWTAMPTEEQHEAVKWEDDDD
ncbi:MAG: hypothetical protein IKP40_13935 [Clostridia bacterium]|nr:hypothetical protein [Clostridia bacterium]